MRNNIILNRKPISTEKKNKILKPNLEYDLSNKVLSKNSKTLIPVTSNSSKLTVDFLVIGTKKDEIIIRHYYDFVSANNYHFSNRISTISNSRPVMRFVRTPRDFVKVLKQYRSINRLDIYTHGAPGELVFFVSHSGGRISLKEFKNKYFLKEKAPQIKEINLLGCNIAQELKSVVAFAKVFKAQRITGVDQFIFITDLRIRKKDNPQQDGKLYSLIDKWQGYFLGIDKNQQDFSSNLASLLLSKIRLAQRKSNARSNTPVTFSLIGFFSPTVERDKDGNIVLPPILQPSYQSILKVKDRMIRNQKREQRTENNKKRLLKFRPIHDIKITTQSSDSLSSKTDQLSSTPRVYLYVIQVKY